MQRKSKDYKYGVKQFLTSFNVSPFFSFLFLSGYSGKGRTFLTLLRNDRPYFNFTSETLHPLPVKKIKSNQKGKEKNDKSIIMSNRKAKEKRY